MYLSLQNTVQQRLNDYYQEVKCRILDARIVIIKIRSSHYVSKKIAKSLSKITTGR